MKKNIPKHWYLKKISDIGQVIGGGTPSTKEDIYYGGDIPWLTPKDLSNYNQVCIDRGERNITKLGLKNSSAKLMPEGTVLFSSRAPIGYVAIAKNKISTNQGFKSVICNDKFVDNKFVYYTLKYYKEAIENIAAGSTFKEVSGKVLKEFKIPIPPLKEQKEISKILFSIDEKIELNNKMNETLEAIGQAIFKHWFVHFEFPDENGQPYKSSGGEMVDSELGEIPAGWDVVKLEDHMDFLEGPGIRNWQYTDEGIPFINIRLINDGEIDRNKANFVSKDELEKYNHFLLKENDLVISTSGTLGRNAVVRKEHLPLLLNTSVIRFRPINLTYSYMYFYLTSKRFYEELLIHASGSVQLNFGPMHLKRISFILPSTTIQEKFEFITSKILKKLNQNRSEILLLSQIRDSLLPKLMSGKIRVPMEVSND